MGGFGGGGMSANSNCQFNVSGGTIYVSAQGDGLDSNGSISISGGLVLCEGPTNGGNSAIDNIVYTDCFKEIASGTVTQSYSDHYMLWAEFEIN
jgi:hypothetical protein